MNLWEHLLKPELLQYGNIVLVILMLVLGYKFAIYQSDRQAHHNEEMIREMRAIRQEFTDHSDRREEALIRALNKSEDRQEKHMAILEQIRALLMRLNNGRG